MPKPNDFFIGVAEFFGSLAPGTVLVALLWRLGSVPGFTDEPRSLIGFSEGALVAALIVAGYLAGNLVSVLGSTLDHTYDAVRKRRRAGDAELAYQRAKRLRNDELHVDGDNDAPMNTFQWARAVLAIEHREAFDEVGRHEAASKLFRSMVVVSLALAVAGAARARARPDVVLGAVAAAVLSYWPYLDRRDKCTETAYRLVIVLRSTRLPSDAALGGQPG